VQTIGIGELQKNMGILTHLTEALTIIDKRKNKEVAVVYPVEKNSMSVLDTLAGKYSKYAQNQKNDKSFNEIRDEAMMQAMKDKYDFLD
jgi:hypothetical protein